MVRVGRLHPFATIGISHFVCVFAIFKLVASAEYGIPIEIRLWDSKRTPLTHMVDVTNEFAVKVLAEHNFLNDNNIAFSPYGLMGILVALYEGVDGESSYQIQRSLQLPWNRNVMRIGFRDIHRTLKTYFVPEEGFLAGLALNNENVTFKESYQKILQFYGFDLENVSQFTSKPNNSTTEVPQSNINSNSSTISQDTSKDSAITSTAKITTRKDLSTINSTEGNKEVTTLGPQTETDVMSTTDIRGQYSSPSSTTSISTDTTINSNETSIMTTDNVQTTALRSNVVTDPLTVSLITTETTSLSTAHMSAQESTAFTTESTLNMNEITSTFITTTNAEASTTTDSSSFITSTIGDTLMSSTNSVTDTQQTETMSTIASTVVAASDSSTTSTTSTLETLERRKKSVVDFLFTSPPYAEDYFVYRSFDIGTDLPNENDGGDKMFLANGLRHIQVSYMHYDSIMEYAYLPHLEASALRLPLDSDRYYLLAILPARRGTGELGRLLARMTRESDLSDVYAAMYPRRVRAVVPSFTVKGHVTLTTDLQKLGIRNVFEPRQNDFTPMTQQPGVYVRSVEQAVSVAIRKYQPDNLKNRHIANRNPVLFSATYPFIYFVMDTNIHVALMAGKMVDPLNTRIL